MSEFLNSKKFIGILILLIICLGVFGCAKPKINSEQPTKKTITITDSIGNMGAIGKALGCMFGSKDPICDKKNVDEQSEEDWNKTD